MTKSVILESWNSLSQLSSLRSSLRQRLLRENLENLLQNFEEDPTFQAHTNQKLDRQSSLVAGDFTLRSSLTDFVSSKLRLT